MAGTDFILQDFFGERRQDFVSHVPHAVEIGIVVEELAACQALMRIPHDGRLVGDPSRGTVFGGVITTLLDQAGGAAVMCSLRELTSIATIDLRIDYMRPATPGLDLFGHAECYRLTRNVAFVRARAFHEGGREDPFAISLSTYMLAANPAPPGMARVFAAGTAAGADSAAAAAAGTEKEKP